MRTSTTESGPSSKQGGSSRDLHDISGQFPEVVEAAEPLGWDGILDAELLAHGDGAVLPFQALQSRLGAEVAVGGDPAEVPVFVAFDLLGLETERQADRGAPPRAEERRRRLDAIDLPSVDDGGGFARSRLSRVDLVHDLELAFTAARARRNEGS